MENNINYNSLISKLKTLKESKGVSDYKIAQDSGLQRSTIKRIFDLETESKAGNLFEILRVMGINFCLMDENNEILWRSENKN
ncbi:helix-turn-helix domain-containing protein [Chryseobacterium vrystaatense]|uniref:Cro/C1-type HTH DNA-binding domain-containing protein n=1 Tax=Chryseobacterium vrystaatense TaxID=307480 RepID=A0ABR4UJC2_9FLAO|nr:hypothetical protein [Chryseobacterium vrystaatense]KFF24753.1 hypothetical protein IW16_17615 [Chryseobacterium vrystaatense]